MALEDPRLVIYHRALDEILDLAMEALMGGREAAFHGVKEIRRIAKEALEAGARLRLNLPP